MAEILLVGSDRERSDSVLRVLREDGHRVRVQGPVDLWREAEDEIGPELVVVAVDSIDSVLSVPGSPDYGFPAPILWVQQDTGFSRDPFLQERLIDRIASPFMSAELLGRVDALVRVRRVIQRHPTPALDAETAESRDRRHPARRLSGVGSRLAALLRTRIPKHEKPIGPYLEVAARVADWADRRDAFEPGHAERVTSFCAMIGEVLGMDAESTSALLRAAMLHDIGKVGLPFEVLHQQTPLAEGQMKMIRTHAQQGAELLRALDRDEDVADAIHYHHERPDGSGYYGKRGEIPLTSCVLAVAEVYDAMTSSRVKQQLSRDEALERLESMSGSILDPDCVDALVQTLRPGTPRAVAGPVLRA